MWTFHASRAFEKSARTLPKAYLQRISEWHAAHASGVSRLEELSDAVWLTNKRQFGRVRFGKYRLGLIIDEENQRIILAYVGARGDFYKRFPPE
jgi:mRNA-degrading endonuclease RelE of RelBE toxin-antitoxin system